MTNLIFAYKNLWLIIIATIISILYWCQMEYLWRFYWGNNYRHCIYRLIIRFFPFWAFIFSSIKWVCYSKIWWIVVRIKISHIKYLVYCSRSSTCFQSSLFCSIILLSFNIFVVASNGFNKGIISFLWWINLCMQCIVL